MLSHVLCPNFAPSSAWLWVVLGIISPHITRLTCSGFVGESKIYPDSASTTIKSNSRWLDTARADALQPKHHTTFLGLGFHSGVSSDPGASGDVRQTGE